MSLSAETQILDGANNIGGTVIISDFNSHLYGNCVTTTSFPSIVLPFLHEYKNSNNMKGKDNT
jgi:hypothetical protein